MMSVETEITGSRRITSVRQLDLLVGFMEAHRALALGRVQSKEARALTSRLWSECANICNAEGTYRSPKEWNRYWNDLKGRVKTKLRSISKSISGTGGGPSTDVTLSPIEDRVAAILGRDVVAPLQGVQQNPFQSQDIPASIGESQQLVVESEIVDMDIVQEQNLVDQPMPSTSETLSSQFNQPRPSSSSEPTVSTPLSSISTAQTQPTITQSERRPRLRTSRHSSSVPTESALEESRAIFARIEESKIKVEEKHIEAELKKSEALVEIARAINNVAEALYYISSPTPHQERTRVMESSSSDSDV